VALRYEAGETAAPECVAKGVDDLALRIRALAEDSGVAVIEDPPLARALYAAVEVDQQIPEAHFEAVARIIGFVMSAAQRRAGAPRARPL
jgi:flagellar biosynthetic protein FlhB